MSLVADTVLRVTVVFCLARGAKSTVILSVTSLMNFLPCTVLKPTVNILISHRSEGGVVVNTSLVVTTTNTILTVITFCVRLPI